MIAIDTNLLVYAHRRDSPNHPQAAKVVQELADSLRPWAIPWPCIHEFVGIVTHPKIYRPASTLDQALRQITAWLESPTLVLLGEKAGYWPILCETLHAGRIVGPRVHDGRIVAICRQAHVAKLLSADRDFSRWDLEVENPLQQ